LIDNPNLPPSRVWKLTLANGTEQFITAHNVDFTPSGVVYFVEIVMRPGADKPTTRIPYMFNASAWFKAEEQPVPATSSLVI